MVHGAETIVTIVAMNILGHFRPTPQYSTATQNAHTPPHLFGSKSMLG